jgi:hypothetical protein
MKTLKRWRPLIATAALLVSSGTWAATVQPITVTGSNFTSCSQLGVPGLVGGSSGSTPTDPQTYDLGNGQSITFDFNPNGQSQYVDFSATVPMDYVIIKAGNDYNIFHYDPALMADTHLYGPNNGSGDPAGVSHVAFCFLPKPTGSKTAVASWKRYTDWQIEKSVTPDSITMLNGDSHDVDYTVTVTPTTRGAYRVAGTITVKDPYNYGWNAVAVTDTMQFNNNATQFSLAWDGVGGNVDTLSCTKPAPNADNVILTCPYEFTLQSTSYPFLLTATGGVNAAGITTSKSGQPNYVFAATQAFAVPGSPAASYGDTFSVDDSMLGSNPDHVFTLGGSYTWTYPRTFTCGQDQGKHDNTATGGWSTGPSTNGTASDSASVTVNCKTVTITKSATTRYSRDYAWDPEKWIVVSDADTRLVSRSDCQAAPIASGEYVGYFLCNDAAIKLNPGDSYDTVYKLTATQSIADENGFAVSGSIDVSWPAGVTPDFSPANPTDTLHFTDATGGTQDVVPSCGAQGATSLSCTYDAPLPRDSVPGYNQASITRNKKCYAADGTPSNCGTMTYDSNQAALTYGSPNVENNKCVAISDLFNGIPGLNLGNTFSWIVNANACASFSQFVTGDINPDPLVTNSLDISAAWIPLENVGEGKSCQFVVPNLLMLGGNGDDEATVGVTVTQLCDAQILLGCTYTQGYWKTHVNYAPKPQFSKKRDSAWDLIDGAGAANEGAIFFLSGMSYINVMWTAPKGNPYYNLAHQYIAAKLNVLDGADDSAVAADLAQAEAWFSVYPPSSPFWKKNQNAIEIAGHLGSFNEGSVGPGHCSVSPATLKAAGE